MAMAQRMSSRVVPKIVGSVLSSAHSLLFPCNISRENSGSVKKLTEKNRYLPRSQTGNIFPSLTNLTVVLRRHPVWVREFHLQFCYSAGTLFLLTCTLRPYSVHENAWSIGQCTWHTVHGTSYHSAYLRGCLCLLIYSTIIRCPTHLLTFSFTIHILLHVRIPSELF